MRLPRFVSTVVAPALAAVTLVAATPVALAEHASATTTAGRVERAQRPEHSSAATTPSVAGADAEDTARYAAAEKASPDAAKFRGGAAVVVIGPIAVLVGLLVLVILL
jgi:hypothetical protein